MNNKICLKKILSMALLPLAFCGMSLAEGNAKISVSHPKGNVEVPLNPKRVVVMDYGSLDTIDALNLDLELAVPKRSMPKYLSKFRGDKYPDVGSVKEFDLEAINVFKPDLIVISSRQQDYYRELSKIAPVYCVNTLAKDQLAEARKNAEFFGKIFNKEKEVAEFLKNIDETVARVNREAKQSGLKALVLLANDGKISAERYPEINIRFHLRIAEASGNNVLCQHISTAIKTTDVYMVLYENYLDFTNNRSCLIL